MSAEQLATRLLSEEAQISGDRIRRGDIGQRDFDKFVQVSREIAALPIEIDDTPAITLSALRTRCRRLKRTRGLAMIVVDYLQLMRPSAGTRPESRVQEISQITQGLKAIAKELEVPVLALSQLSRQVESREDKRPQLSDLRESGIDRAGRRRGDVHLPRRVLPAAARAEGDRVRQPGKVPRGAADDFQQKMERVHNQADLIIAKQRHGPTGAIKLFFEAEFTRFADLEHSCDGLCRVSGRAVRRAKRKGSRNSPSPCGRGLGGGVVRHCSRDPTHDPSPQPPPTRGGGVSCPAPAPVSSDARAAGAVLEIDLGAIVANWRLLCAHHPSGPVAGVVKADAYGCGALPVASALHAAGCRHFFVALLDEALAIRPHLPDAMVAVLGGPMPGSEPDYIAHDITPVLNSLAELDAWSAAARQAGRRLPALLHVDTGMSRLGLDAQRTGAGSRRSRTVWTAIALRYIMTHLVSSEAADDPLNEAQLRPFRRRLPAYCRRHRAAWPTPPASFWAQRWGSDLARPGAALYGVNPTPGRANPMRLPLRLRARVLAVRDVLAGASGRLQRHLDARRAPAASPPWRSAMLMAGTAACPTAAERSLTATGYRW